MRRFLWILLLWPSLAFGAAGDYFGAQIDSSGWQLWLQFNGMQTNGTFTFGFLTNNSLPTTPAVVVTLTSQGYDDTGTLISTTRTIYGTKQIRFPYNSNGQQNFPDVSSNSPANITLIKVALSDYVFSTESNITVTVASGFYSTNGVNSAAVTSMPVTNNSAATHPKCIANWSYPGFQQITNNTMTVRAVGFHRSAMNGRPLRMIQFVARDQHSHAVTNMITNMSIDSTLGDPVPVCEYIANMDISTFTQGDAVRCDFRAYPWIGDNGSVLDTMDNVNSQPTTFYASITNLCDRTGAYGLTYAIVATNGSDSTGVAWTNSAITWHNPFATCGGAITAIAGTNNTFKGRNDTGGGVVLLTTGNFGFKGASTDGNHPYSWLTIKPYPTNTAYSAAITNQLSSGFHFILHLSNLLLASLSANTFVTIEHIWTDQCVVNSGASGSVLYYTVTNAYFTWSTISNLDMGLQAFSGSKFQAALVRGNDLTGLRKSGMWYTVLGNITSSKSGVANGPQWGTTSSGSLSEVPSGNIFAYNAMLGCSNIANNILGVSSAQANTFGAAIVQNVFEGIATNQTSALLAICADNSTAENDNYLLWNNVVVGERANASYNDSGTVSEPKKYWSIKNNNFDDWNIKSDTFTGTANGNRVGNWSGVFGVGCSGNVVAEISVMSAAGSFVFEGQGLNTFQQGGNGTPASCTKQSEGFFGYINNLSYQGGLVDHAGQGNYRINSTSLPKIDTETLIPFDLEGNNRGGFDPPGAYASASPRKGAGFFAQ